METKLARPIGKKQQILDAAIALLAQGGSAAWSATALAGAAGVSKANLFHHFRSIDDIMVAALEQFIQSMPAMTPSPGTPLREWLLALGADTASLMETQHNEAGAYVAFISRAQADPRLRARIEEVLKGAEEAFAAAIDLLAPGRWPDHEVQRLAALIVMAGDGLAIHRQLFPDRASRQQSAWATLVDLIAPQEN